VKVGDLVRSVDEEDDNVGVVILVTPEAVSDRVDVFWGLLPNFGRQFEWDWDFNLEIVRDEQGGQDDHEHMG
jgi:hypothetical protein